VITHAHAEYEAKYARRKPEAVEAPAAAAEPVPGAATPEPIPAPAPVGAAGGEA